MSRRAPTAGTDRRSGRVWRLVGLCGIAATMAGCSRAPSDPSAAPSPAARPSAAATGVDGAYVRRVLADTAVDFRSCRRRPQLDPGGGVAGSAGEVILAVDSSGSMAARAGRVTRMDEAKGAIAAFLSGVPGGTSVALAVFGDVGDNSAGSKARSCEAPIRFAYGPGPMDAGAIRAAAAGLHPAGWTPLANAIRTAAGRFSTPGPAGRTLYIVSDGIESCGGDPVAAAAAAHAQAQVVVNVVGFDVRAPAEVAALSRVAAAGGGSYGAASPGQLRGVLLRKLASARSGNTTAMFKAMYGMHDCYIAGIRRQSDALIARLDDDRATRRANSATLLAASRAGSDRTLAALREDVRLHQGNMRDTRDANAGIDNRMDGIAPR